METLEWGLSNAVPSDARAAWGARAIFTTAGMDLLPDRQSIVGGNEERASLIAILNGCGLLKLAQRRFRELVNDGTFRNYEEAVATLFEDNVVRFDARCAGGYVYIAAWLKPQPALALPESQEETGAGVLTWSCNRKPAIGDLIEITMNKIGEARVVGWAVQSFPATDKSEGSNYLFMLALPTNPPAWLVKQDQRDAESGKVRLSYAHVMGREWRYNHP